MLTLQWTDGQAFFRTTGKTERQHTVHQLSIALQDAWFSHEGDLSRYRTNLGVSMKILCQLKCLNEIYSAYTTFPIQNDLKQGDAVRHFSTLLTMPLGTPKKTRRKRNLIDKNISCLVFAEDANFLGENINGITKNTDTLLVSNKEV